MDRSRTDLRPPPEAIQVGSIPDRSQKSANVPFDGEIRKRICKTILVNSGLLLANYACACNTAVLKDSFSNPFSDFSIER